MNEPVRRPADERNRHRVSAIVASLRPKQDEIFAVQLSKIAAADLIATQAPVLTCLAETALLPDDVSSKHARVVSQVVV